MAPTIQRLTSATGDAFAGMTYGRYKPCVRLPELMLHKTLALGLYVDGQPAGLVLAQARLRDVALDPTCELLSIFVAPERRRAGHAARLLNAVAESARAEGFGRLLARYATEQPKSPMISALLRAAGFAPPEPSSHVCAMNARDVVRAPILRHTRLPDGYDTLPWSAVPSDRKQALETQIAQNLSYDVRLAPESRSAPIQSDCSLVLEHNGHIVGWMVARIVAPGTLEYSSLFIEPAHRHSRTVVAMIARAVNAQVQTDHRETYPRGHFIVLGDTPRWRDSLLRAFAPYSDSVAPCGATQIKPLLDAAPPVPPYANLPMAIHNGINVILGR